MRSPEGVVIELSDSEDEEAAAAQSTRGHDNATSSRSRSVTPRSREDRFRRSQIPQREAKVTTQLCTVYEDLVAEGATVCEPQHMARVRQRRLAVKDRCR